MNVGMLLKEKGDQVWSIDSQDTVYSALTLMAEKNVGALLVMEDERIVGIFTERDYARKIIIKGRFSKDTLVREVMTEEVCCVERGLTLDQCMAIMTAKRVRHLPVLENSKLIGLISIGDVVKHILGEQEHTIEDLYRYIHGIY